MRKILCGTLLAAAALTVNAQTVKVGWFGPQTGDSALWGQAELATVKMMAEDYNKAGGILVGGKKYKVEIVGYDDKGDSVEAVNVVKRLVSQDNVVAIVGAQGSGEAIPVAPIVNEAKVPPGLLHRHQPQGHGPATTARSTPSCSAPASPTPTRARSPPTSPSRSWQAQGGRSS